MPDYKTHSIHSELVLPNINNKVIIQSNDLKRFSFGPDALITTDYHLFDYQHSHYTKDFFETLIKRIKENKLYDNGKVMSFLYGELDHFVLDLIMHPLIYYMTEKMPSKYILKPHSLIEMWIADYIMNNYNKREKNYYLDTPILNNELKSLIDTVYCHVYKRENVANKYDKGIRDIIKFDLLRFTKNEFIKSIIKGLRIGDIFYSNSYSRIISYLNLEKSILTNPINGEEFTDSFVDLWNKSLMVSGELINDVNNYLY